jgi:ABC-type uncharacterized transport system involved in gliding motility auxiliary subunit
MKNFTQTSRTILKFLAVVVILVVLNVLAQRGGLQWDMTEADLYSITDRSRDIARGVEESTTIYFFHTPQSGRSTIDPSRVRILLRQYDRTGKNITFEEVDHTRNPGLAREHGIRKNNVILIKSGKRTKKLGRFDLMQFSRRRGGQRQFRGESAITTALLKMSRATDRSVLFASGHGEYRTEPARDRSLSRWSQSLSEEGYTVKSFNPLTDDLPDTRDMVVISDPTREYSSGILERLKKWRNNGGNLLVAASPPSGKTLNPLLEGSGLQFEARQIIDPQRRVQSLQSLVNPFVFAPMLESHPALSSLKDQGLAVQMGRSAPLQLRSDTPQKLLTTSGEAMAKPLTGKKIRVEFNPETDERGPFTVGAVVKPDDDRGTVLAFGSPTLFGDAYLGRTPGNESFAVNLINWVFDRDVSLGIQPTPSDYNRVRVPAGQAFVLQVTALFVIPLGILLWGGWVWWNRKNR